jgi:hypothetical protein
MDRITDKKSIGERFGDKKLMNKKPVTNEKYKNIQKTLDTGRTINDVQVLTDKFVAKRKNELFKRIKGSTLVKLLEENQNSESIYNLANENNEGMMENIYQNQDNISTSNNHSVMSSKTHQTNISAKTSVTAITYATEMLGNLVIFLNKLRVIFALLFLI